MTSQHTEHKVPQLLLLIAKIAAESIQDKNFCRFSD